MHANVGVQGGPAALDLEDLWIRDLTIWTGLVHTSYDTFARAAETGAREVVVER